MSEPNIETVDKMNSNENNVENVEADWDSIIEDAKIVKSITLTWDGKPLTVFFKELIGAEDMEIDKRIGNDEGRIILEKTYMMILKANKGDDSPSDMTRPKWDNLPARLRNLICFKVIAENLAGMKPEDFQNLPVVPERSS